MPDWEVRVRELLSALSEEGDLMKEIICKDERLSIIKIDNKYIITDSLDGARYELPATDAINMIFDHTKKRLSSSKQ